MATRQQQLSAIMTAESGGKNQYNYLYNTNPSYYTASGYYQITNTTWKQGAAWAGVDTSQYPTAISAPYSVQTQVANSLIDHVGMSPWSGSKANTYLNQIDSGQNVNLITSPVDSGSGISGGTQIASGDTGNTGYGSNGTVSGTNASTTPLYYNEYDSNGNYVGGVRSPADIINSGDSLSPVYAGDAGAQAGSSAVGSGSGTSTITVTPSSSAASNAGSGASGAAAAGGDVGYVPPASTGGPQYFGLAGGVVTSIQSWINGIETAVGTAFKNAASALFGGIENTFLRFAIIVLAIFLLLIALWRLMDPDGSKTKAVMRDAMVAA